MRRMVVIALLATALTATALAGGGSEAPAMEAMSVDDARIPFTTLADAQQLAAERPTVLFFYATWCPTCQAAMRDIDARLDELSNVALVIVDYDNERALKQRYGVTYQHTFVRIDAEGNALTVWNGGAVDEILAQVKG